MNKEKINELIKSYKKRRSVSKRDQIVAEVAPIVDSIAHRFVSRGEEREDVRQIGMIGLLKAIEYFAPERNMEFIPYVITMIMGEIRHYFRDNFNTIKIPRKYFDVSHAMNEFVKVYFQKSKGKMPTVKEIAKGINYDEELILETAEAMQLKSLVKLDVGSGSQKTSKPKEVSDNSIMYQEDDKNQIFSDKLENTIFMENILNSLSYREMKVLRMYFINKQTQRDIAERFKISQAHVFRVLNKALEHAKSKIKEVLKD